MTETLPLAPPLLPCNLEDEIRVVAEATARKLGAQHVTVARVHTEVRYALHVDLSCHTDRLLAEAVAAAVREVVARHATPAGEIDVVVEHHAPGR